MRLRVGNQAARSLQIPTRAASVARPSGPVAIRPFPLAAGPFLKGSDMNEKKAAYSATPQDFVELSETFPDKSVCYQTEMWSYASGRREMYHAISIVPADPNAKLLRVESTSFAACVESLKDRLCAERGETDPDADVPIEEEATP